MKSKNQESLKDSRGNGKHDELLVKARVGGRGATPLVRVKRETRNYEYYVHSKRGHLLPLTHFLR